MFDLSVVICTYNGETRIGTVLERLRSQRPTPFTWEILIVNNNSTDNTQQIIDQYQQEDPSLRSVIEPQQGLAYARSRGVQDANGELVAFLDDDTLPDSDWVNQIGQFAKTHPQAGAFGGQIHGDYEVEPSPELKKVAVFLAVIERGSKPYCYEPKKRMLPPGAGLVVRRQVWLDAVQTQLVGRTTAAMLASEDIEAIAQIQTAGWEIWYHPDMHLYHQIPQWRTERAYLLSLVKGMGLARHHIRMVRLRPWQRPFATPLYLLNDLRQLLIHKLTHRTSQDLAAACQRQLLCSSLISPFYLWSLGWRRPESL